MRAAGPTRAVTVPMWGGPGLGAQAWQGRWLVRHPAGRVAVEARAGVELAIDIPASHDTRPFGLSLACPKPGSVRTEQRSLS